MGKLDDVLDGHGKIAAIPVAVPLGLATSVVSERLRRRSAPASHATDPAWTHPPSGACSRRPSGLCRCWRGHR
jgi:hypothetical protein